MAESAVTVVTCRTCSRSADLTLLEGRFWCAWCQDWCDVDAERIDQAAIVRDRHEARLARIPPEPPLRQPLRLPAGFRITYNDFHEIDPDETWVYDREVLMLVHERRQRLVDLSWREDPETEEWTYQLTVVTPDWEHEMHRTRSRERQIIVAELERALWQIDLGRL